MKNKIYLIGNGFDLAHGLPTRFDPDFKNIAQKYEQDKFWDLYQSREDDIWSDFENLLGCPNFNNLEEIFSAYGPDYLSDRESDRDSISYQVDLNGNLRDSLLEFVDQAEKFLHNIQVKDFIKRILDPDGYYITFNYTHVLEELYDITWDQVLHIHGEAGKDNLELGYPEGNFTPEKYSYDARGKGRGPYVETEIENYIEDIEDYNVKKAYSKLVEKCESFKKKNKLELLKDFLDKNQCKIEEIIVYGHSCAIDFDYFNYLNTRYFNAFWKFYVRGEEQEHNVRNLIREYNIKNAEYVSV